MIEQTQWMQTLESALERFIQETELKAGSLLVVGCSTSEVFGSRIGKAPQPELGKAIAKTLYEVTQKHGIDLAVQCCEHLNRALVLPDAVAQKRGYEPVTVRPVPHAGGSCGAAYYELIEKPCVVEAIRADAGMDIGDTLIGMHLKSVAVPIRLDVDAIGHAHLVLARSRPKLIGGPRAVYP